MLTQEKNGRLVVAGEIVVDGAKFPSLRRALERGRNFMVKKGLIACAASQSMEPTNHTEDAMAKKTGAKSVKGAKAAAKETKATEAATAPKAPKERDPRIPPPGGTIIREYKGKLHHVQVLEAGFEFEGTTYPSLTALALKITGAKAISGPAFFKLAAFKPVEAK